MFTPITSRSDIKPRHLQLQLPDRPKALKYKRQTVRGLGLHADTANHAFVSPDISRVRLFFFSFFVFLKSPSPFPRYSHSHSTLDLHPRQKMAGSSRSKRKGATESAGVFWIAKTRFRKLAGEYDREWSLATCRCFSRFLAVSRCFSFSLSPSCSCSLAHFHQRDSNA